MNIDSHEFRSDDRATARGSAKDMRPILIVPYMWIGDFVRCHSVVKVLRQRFPDRPVDLLATPLCAPLADYMPSVRQAIVANLPRSRLALSEQNALAQRLRKEGYGTALTMPRTWKAALAPFLAGIPERIGFAGELRFILLNDVRFGEKKLPRMVDRCAMLALPRAAAQPPGWPLPELNVPTSEIAAWRIRRGLTEDRPIVALAPGAVGPSKRWTTSGYSALAHRLKDDGAAVWVLGGPGEKSVATKIAAESGALDLTGTDLRNGILAMAAASVAVSNDSGLMHIAAALGTPTMGIFGPTSPYHWAPLNGLAATVQTKTSVPCQPCHRPICTMNDHRCMRDIPATDVVEQVTKILGGANMGAAH